MLSRLAPALVQRRRFILVIAVIALAAAAGFGGGVAKNLVGGGFDDPGAESSRAKSILETRFGQGEPNLVLIARASSGNVDDRAAVTAGQALTERLRATPGVAQVVSYWSIGRPPSMKSTGGDKALVLVRVAGDEDVARDRAEAIADRASGPDGPLVVSAGGQAIVNHQVSARVEADLGRAESIALPVTLVLLIVVFGSVVSALLPLAVGILAIIGTFAVLQLLSLVTDVSIFSLNLTTALGLGLAIDYSLFIVSRYREELRGGHEPDEALVITMRTAGRTVLFSAATVAAALLALLVFPLYFLRSFGYAGIAVVALAATGALVVLPALLAVLGRRVDALRLPLGRRRRRAPALAAVGASGPAASGASGAAITGAAGASGAGAAGASGAGAAGAGPSTSGAWHRIAMTVMRRPLPIALGVVAVLLVLGAPFLGVRFGLPDDRVLPTSAVSRQVSDAIRGDFGARDTGTLAVVATRTGAPTTRGAEIDRYATALSQLDGVSRVDALTGTYVDGRRLPAQQAQRFATADGTWLAVVPSVEPYSSAGEDLVARVRALPAPFPVQVAGPSAQLVDTKAALLGHLPLAIGIIAAVTFVLLFLMTGSVVVPFKALILNLLSLTAVYGAMVFIFQDGHLAGLLGFTATGTIDTSMPVLLFCIAFGLSMDYEVFLLSRIKEEHDRGADTVTAVAAGLERSGRIVTTLAALLAIIFVAFATSQVTFLKLFGVGTALAVIVDATLIRALLVPAFMRLAGRANWWAPRPLRLLHDRVGLREDVGTRPIAEVTRT
jgi:putative drug exporter of the RND superfamily